ncbi:9221_t:CDS:2 [Funneliformis caledonium]|uniref:9221_t:CDS:1 n=1 Tax=Funneliformis caledonium TaxID=1117310 RepID=A0A9N8YZR7_9GLOM|nr:9221_t:CDS:2 [Funneliformis caledonium]
MIILLTPEKYADTVTGESNGTTSAACFLSHSMFIFHSRIFQYF